MNEKTESFEKAFERLDQILKLLNEGKISLDESLKLFEEADLLMNKCASKLSSAEQRIEKLIKNRKNELALDDSGSPVKEPFYHNPSNPLSPTEDELSPFR
jgi:exodeoxyribonuclease VII small subunit